MKLLKMKISKCFDCPFYQVYKGRDITGEAYWLWQCNHPETYSQEVGDAPKTIPEWCALEDIE